MGTTVQFTSIINAIGRELSIQIQQAETGKAAALAHKAEFAAVALDLRDAAMNRPNTSTTALNAFTNLIYQFNLEQAAIDDAQAAAFDVKIAALTQQVNDAAAITGEALGMDADGNVDFDIALGAITAGLQRDKTALVGGAEQALSDAQAKAVTIDALIEMAQGFTPGML
jgi:hypothetical protein